MTNTIKFEVGEKVQAINVEPLPGKGVAPKLELDRDYEIRQICLDKEGNQHLDVGLVSAYNFVKSYETGEELPNGDSVHWCHPSRFVKA